MMVSLSEKEKKKEKKKTLHELIKDGEWDVVQDWYESHPEEIIGHVDPSNYGSTILHALCVIPSVPVRLLEFVITVWPDAVLKQEQKFGALPLHLLCWISQGRSAGTTQKVNLLLQRMKPQDLMIRNNQGGSTCLHSACGSHADISVIQALVRKHPPVLVAKTFDQHHTAMHALWHSHLQSIPGLLQIASILGGNNVVTTTTDLHFKRFWSKMEFLAIETFRMISSSSSSSSSQNVDNNDDDNNNSMDDNVAEEIILSNYMLHGMFELRSPLNALKVALKLNPTVASYPDQDGNYPLHQAVIRRPFRVKDKELIQALLQAAPTVAAKRNKAGDAPVHVAIRDRMEWEEGLCQLVNISGSIDGEGNGEDDVLGLPDPHTGLYPFLLCASLGGTVCVNNTFCLLIAKPDLVKEALSEKNIKCCKV
mmetsp:Transcript_25091/g.28046  ORF Transcript_25091/g.28046 Transcript_25091/m.28046 type:complete len:423 (+) Transcript_25091:2-1270(+)